MNSLNIEDFHSLISTPNVIIGIREYPVGLWQRFRTATPISFFVTEVDKNNQKFYFCRILYKTNIFLNVYELNSILKSIEQMSHIADDEPFQTRYCFNSSSDITIEKQGKSWSIRLSTEEIGGANIEEFLNKLKDVRSKIESLSNPQNL